MKVLLRNRVTGEYFRGQSQWTTQRKDAFVFPGSARALIAARELPRADLELLLVFDDPAHDLCLPLPRSPLLAASDPSSS